TAPSCASPRVTPCAASQTAAIALCVAPGSRWASSSSSSADLASARPLLNRGSVSTVVQGCLLRDEAAHSHLLGWGRDPTHRSPSRLPRPRFRLQPTDLAPAASAA